MSKIREIEEIEEPICFYSAQLESLGSPSLLAAHTFREVWVARLAPYWPHPDTAWTSPPHLTFTQKLDGVGPVDNRPSTD